ncbi:YHS domain-containing (seleno)protein [Nisaea nitritireducens]|uniref:YHS domain-containing (seleno)protein n=1 Tax=Nisaea nitritireducens TaxID=568392 RepID=UPI001866ADFD|nr:YHS domain-containing (seleno)protein [Nisaea nitritireducens]
MSVSLVLRSGLVAAGIVAGSLFLTPAPLEAGENPVYTGFLSNLAVNGYDPVAYFLEGRPVEGKADYTLDYMGAEWRFASAENREAFRQDPERYAPQYGGYCAWAVAQGSTAKGDPMNWRIVNGKLYLNYNADIQTRWERDISGNIQSADQNWPRIIE